MLMVASGLALLPVNDTCAVATQPFEAVTDTIYVPAVFVVKDSLILNRPASPCRLQAIADIAPPAILAEAVRVTSVFVHESGTTGAMDTDGNPALPVTLMVAVAVQPPVPSPVTVYVPGASITRVDPVVPVLQVYLF